MLLLTLLFAVHSCEPYKILIVNPKLAYSHMNFMGKIADVLLRNLKEETVN
ncbi:unnamed protein product [Cylicostephanus goldi]|uniref:Uncharacterized protein n=1 Tax=Cylicostephanus goldi TaxID=71465 RepID=A0A3P7N1E6_CYLGO|nr:unnamed protein product [Cylicostephanus goldi]